jgi:PTS system beta-glucosides-specific IIC component
MFSAFSRFFAVRAGDAGAVSGQDSRYRTHMSRRGKEGIEMSKYNELAKALPDAVGGRENVAYFQHCTTRLRFNVKDRSRVDLKKIEAMDKVVGTQWSNEELQVIIGPAVAEAYRTICKEMGMEEQGAVEEPSGQGLGGKKLTPLSLVTGIMDGISGSITPLIPMMIGGGMIKVIYMLANMAGVLPESSTTYQILYWLGDAFIYFFPVFLGATSAKKFGANQGVGMLLGALLIYPAFINAAAEGTALTIFGLPVYVTNYSTTVIPIILTVWVLGKVEKLVSAVCPDILKACLVPTFSLLIVAPVMLVLTAPFGYFVGTYITAAVIWIYETIGFLGVAALCALLPLMVMTGMHTMMTPYWTTAFASLGYDPFFLPAMILSNLNQATAAFAVGLKARNPKLKSTALSCAATAFIAGVTEPAMFGITLKYKKPLYAALVGNAAAGLTAGLLKAACYAFPGSGGLFAIVTFVGPGSNLIRFLLALAAGVAVTFVMTMILGFEEEGM